MGGFIVDGQPYEPPLRAADAGYAGTPPDGGGLGADLKAFGTIVAGGLQRYGETLDGGGNGANLPPDPILQADEANKAFSPPGATLFTHPIAQSVARNMGKEAADQAQRDQFLSRWAATANPVERFGVPLAAGLLDPNNLALAFVPGLGEETFLAGLGKAGITGFGARVASRAMSGATTFAAATPFQIGLDAAQKIGSGQNYEFDMRDAMRQLALNASIGALLHTGVGFAARDSRAFLLRGEPPEAGFTAPAGEDVQPEPPPASVRPSPEASAAADAIARAPASTAKAAIDTAVAQTIDGRPVDVAPVFDAARGETRAAAGDTVATLPARFTDDQMSALAEYTIGGSRDINGALLGRDQKSYTPEAIAKLTTNLDTAIAAHPLNAPQTLFWGTTEAASRELAAIKAGQSWTSKAYISTSSSKEMGRDMTGARDGRLVRIQAPEGAPVLDLNKFKMSMMPHQSEFLAARGTTLRKIGETNGVIDAEIVRPNEESVRTPQDVAAAQQQIYRDGFAPGVDQTDLDETNAAVYGQERAPSARQPPPSKGAGSETGARAQAALDERIADAERQLADAGIILTKEERAEIEQAKAQVAAADQAADGYSQAGDCLTSAGV